MNRNHLIGFAATAALLGLLALFAWHFFEINPRTRNIPPSREARTNEYLALDRWLENMGRPARILSSGNLPVIYRAEERGIFIQASLFRWSSEAVEYLIQWIEEGGRLILVLDYSAEWELWDETELISLLHEFGIEPKTGVSQMSFRHDENAPNFSRDFSFELLQTADLVFDLKDSSEHSRLVQVKRGMGNLTVSGRPRFLLSTSLGDAPNSRLTWALFAADPAPNRAPGNEGAWLFIRGATRVRGLLGSLFKHGNLDVLGVSALVLLVIGFWTVIPAFGLLRRDDEKPGKPLRERFIAEGRFLKRHGALGFYRDTYVKEIKRRLARNEGLISDDKTIRRALDILGMTGDDRDSRLLAAALRGEPFTYSEFPKMINMFKTILERI